MVQVQTEWRDVYLIQSDEDIGWVEENIAMPLLQRGLCLRFDKWHIIAGTLKQESMIEGLNNSRCCAVCIGKNALGGLIGLLQKAALERKTTDSKYLLIPVLLPGSKPNTLPEFLDLFWEVDFRNEKDFEYQYHRLVSAIQGKAAGPPPLRHEKEREDQSQKIAEKELQINLDQIQTDQMAGKISQNVAEYLQKAAYKNFQKRVAKILSGEPVTINL